MSGEQAEERTAREGRLRELAGMATPGPWRLVKRLKNSQNPSVGTDDGEIATCWQKTLPLIEGRVPRNAEYIAAANPQAILDLLSECSRLASRVEELEQLLTSADEVGVKWSNRAARFEERVEELEEALREARLDHLKECTCITCKRTEAALAKHSRLPHGTDSASGDTTPQDSTETRRSK